ncbi:MAG: hypothetical protein BYD32DRAFT_441160 [Podila humilis]|nr:MAG: hypothetical protein BYD32DRAFT_441160 [Podila humilis]
MSSQSDGTHSFALERFGKSNNPTLTSTSTSSSTLSQEGASPETTKEQSTWTHVTTPNLTLQVVLQSNTDCLTPQTPGQQRPRPKASKASKQASYDNTRRSSLSTLSTAGTSSLSPFTHADQDTPRLVVQTGREILEYQRLDPASIGISKMKAMVKGSAMGFKLYHTSSPLEIRKFQVKFRTTEDSARCALLLRKFIQCRNVLSTEGSEVIAIAESSRRAELSASPPSLSSTLLAQPAPSIQWGQSQSQGQGSQSQGHLSIPSQHGSQHGSRPVAVVPPVATTPSPPTMAPLIPSHFTVESTPTMFAHAEALPPSTSRHYARPSSGLLSPVTPVPVEPPPPLPSMPQESTGDMALLSLTPKDLTRALENIARDPSFPTLITRIETIMRPRTD